MKTKIIIFTVFVFCSCLLSENSFGQEVEQQITTEDLIGKWKLDFNKTIKKVRIEDPEISNKILSKSLRRNRLSKFYKNKRLVFTDNGTLIEKNKIIPNKEFKWFLEGNKLNLTDERGKTLKFKIRKISSEQLVIKAIYKNKKRRPLFLIQYFNKI
ncbi:lipocalin family protein [Polaribacter porphyrae]|uniref:Lipocalin-like domain-containing protein n=1 Tax=Polaribacter porphyrae TaxID=1137780 RepID=A0A2S7WMF1_9FLAO|nr:lipocalin family protein [Polaribacter porphyrae]PQJ78763.1 hypothetical protein BTO18_05995 [Polaribacter porphyrae]